MKNPPDPLSAETLAKIAALARQVSATHRLHSDLQQELCAHIEDKINAYLAGEEALSQHDAFLLAQAHFGNPQTLRNLFALARPKPLRIPRRRLALISSFGLAAIAAELLTLHYYFNLRQARATASAALTTIQLPAPNLVQPEPSTLPKNAQKRTFNGRTFYIVPLQS